MVYFIFLLWAASFVFFLYGAGKVLQRIKKSDPDHRREGGKPGDTFCYFPFKSLYISPTGSAQPCPAFDRPLYEKGRPMSVLEHSVEEIWNCEDIREIRRAMVDGKPISSCRYCYFHERRGLWSWREMAFAKWEAMGYTPEKLKSEAAASGYRVASRPQELALSLGNLCNLRCMMCYSSFSSAIAADRVQSSWVAPLYPEAPPVEGPAWFRRKDFLYGDLFSDASGLRILSMIGGEPLLIKETSEIMRRLIDAGAAKDITLHLVSNGTVPDDSWHELASQFKHLILAISIDGFEKVDEYIRFPTKWSDIEATLRRWQRLPNTSLVVISTVSAYNMLDIVDLIRYCDDLGVHFNSKIVYEPSHLSPLVMPPAVRRKAAERLRAYVTSGRRPDKGPWLDRSWALLFGGRRMEQTHLLKLAAFWESGGDDFDRDLLRQFMVYTNDLDATRGQSFAATFPELREMIEASGSHWTSDLRFAKPGKARRRPKT